MDRLVREAQESAGEPETEGSVDVDSGRGRRFGRAENRQVGSDSVKGRGADKGKADTDVGDRFGLLVHTLIEGLSRFT